MTYSDRLFAAGTSSRADNGDAGERHPFLNAGTRLLPLIGAAAMAGGAPAQAAPGTQVTERYDLRGGVGTTLSSPVVFEGPFTPVVQPTRMAKVRDLAPEVTMKEWGEVFGVSRQTVNAWLATEPKSRPELDDVVASLNQAATFHTGVGRWLRSPVPGMDIKPIELLRSKRWRAFHGAVRAQAAPATNLAANTLMERRRAEVSWAPPTLEAEAEQA